MWARLRNRRLAGRKFVRQEPVGPYIVDFVCREAMLAVEVDGATHSTENEVSKDERREDYVIQRDFRLLRFNNDEVYHQLDSVLETILTRIDNRT